MTQPNPQHRPGLTESETFKRLFWPAVWLTLFLLAFVTWRLYWKLQLENEKAIVREAGYPADLEELDAWYKKPEGRNAAEVWTQAHADWVEDMALEDWMPRMTTQSDTAAAMYNEQDKLGLQYPDEVLDKVREYWKKNDASWRLMQEAKGIEECRWSVDCKKGFGMLVPYLGEQKKMANYLAERMRLASRDKNWAEFIGMMDTGFKLGNDAGNGPWIISSLVSISIDALMLNTLMQEMPFLSHDGGQLEALQKKLMAQRKISEKTLADGFRSEAAVVLGEPSLRKVMTSSSLMGGSYASKISSVEYAGIMAWEVLGGEDHDRRKIVHYQYALVDIYHLPESKWMDEADKVAFGWAHSLHAWELGCKQLGGIFDMCIKNHLSFLMAFDVTITSVAVERYRVDHGKLPAALSELVPAYLPAVPQDAFDHGKPLKYKILSDRFQVYSNGRNRTDDGGGRPDVVSIINSHPDDISFTLLLPNAKRGIVPKRKDLPEAGK